MQSFRLCVLAYNFPHRKTQDFLSHLHFKGYRIDAVVAFDPVKLNIPESAIRSKIRHIGLIHPRTIAERLGIPYHVVPQEAPRVAALLGSLKMDLGVIAGARILKKAVIDQVPRGIINFHPGLIPEARGLDALFWSLHKGIPPGVTAHLIDSRVDAGKVLLKHRIPVYPGDTLLDLSERLYETQLELLEPAIAAALKGEGTVVGPGTAHNPKMAADLERDLERRVPELVKRLATPR